MAKAHTYYTIDVLFLNSISPKFAHHYHRIVQWPRFSYPLLRKILTLLLAHICYYLNTDTFKLKEIPHPSFNTPPSLLQIHKFTKKDMPHTARRQTQFCPPPRQQFILPLFQPPTQLSSEEKYPLLIHTQPLVLGQVYIPHMDDNTLPSPSSTRCSSSTLALCDNDTRKIFTSSPGPDRMMTPQPVCVKRDQLMTHELLMISPHTYSYGAPFYPVNQTGNREDKIQKNKDEQPSRSPPPPLEVALYRPLQRVWDKHFNDGLQALDLPIMGFHARRLVHCNCIWDEDELMHLSRSFVWRASRRGEQSTDLLATFASEVRGVFHVPPWMGMDENLQRCLWDVVRETFVSSWHFEKEKTSRQAVTYMKNPSPGYKEYVVSALSVCSFIGDLFRYNFISRPNTVGCIRVLMYNLTTVEHIRAIDNIIRHAGVPLWRGAVDLDKEVCEFRMNLMKESRLLKDYRTVLLQPIEGRSNVGVRSRVDAIISYVEGCQVVVVNER